MLKNFWSTYVCAGLTGIYFGYVLFMMFTFPSVEWAALRNVGYVVQLCLFAGWTWLSYGLTRARLRHDRLTDEYVTKIQEAEKTQDTYRRYCREIAATQARTREAQRAWQNVHLPIMGEVIDPPPEPPEQR